MTRTPLTRNKLARALGLLGLAPAARPLPEKTEPIAVTTTGNVTPEVDAHLHAVGERAKAPSKSASR